MKNTFFTSLLLLPFWLLAQQKKGDFLAYGPEAKYFSNLNFSVYQEKKGFLWIGTQNGLVRFDGKRYKNFFSDYANPNSPSDNSIMDMVEDRKGNVWFTGFFHGLTRYDQLTGTFKKYERLSKDNVSHYGIYSGLNDSDGDLWFCTAGRGLAKYNFEKDDFSLYFPEPDKSRDGSIRGDNYVTSVIQDINDPSILWCGTFHGLFSFNKRTKVFTHFPFSNILVNTLEKDEAGNLWIGTWGNGLLCFNTLTRQFDKSKARELPDIIYHIKGVDDSTLYMAALNKGLWKYDLQKHSFTDITPPAAGEPSSSQPDIQRISVTRDAGIFIGGNYFLYQQHPAFKRLENSMQYPAHDEMEGIITQGCAWDEKRKVYWLTTSHGDGIYKIDQGLSKVTSVSYVDVGESMIKRFSSPLVDGLGRAWVLSASMGPMLWNDDRQKFEKHKPGKIPDTLAKSVSVLKTDGQGNIWMISGWNFIYWDVNTDRFTVIPVQWNSDYKDTKNLDGDLEIDPEGNAWLVGRSGIFYCNKLENNVQHFVRYGSDEESLSTYNWLSGTFGKFHGLWLTGGNGIQILDWKTMKVLANHNTGGGLATMRVNSIVTDTSGLVWAGTSAGLSAFDPTKKVWQLFNRFDGLESDYLDNALFITSNNKLIIPQRNGLLIKDAGEINHGTNEPLINITSLLVNEVEYAERLAGLENQLSFPYDQNNIIVEFAAMDWVYAFRNTYWYRIEGPGFRDSWHKSEDARIHLTGLQPGEYFIVLKALSGNSLWSKEISFSIKIRLPFWKTWWFIGICLLLGLGIFYLIYKYRINQLRKVQDMRNNISRNLHDDIGASLSNIHILNELARRNAADSARATGYLEKAGDDIQQISESLSDIVWNINPRYDEIENLFVRMKRYAADMMDGKDISYDMSFPAASEKIHLPMNRRRDLYLVFKEAVNNLVKYSKATRATISISISDNKLIVVIEDNGQGFDPDKAIHGNGLQNMQKRAEDLKGALVIRSKPGSGTQIELRIGI